MYSIFKVAWSECSLKMKYNYKWEAVDMTPIYPWLLNQDLGERRFDD